MLERLTRHYFTRNVRFKSGISAVRAIEVQVQMVQGVLVDIAKVDF